jgi:hypothetical protein
MGVGIGCPSWVATLLLSSQLALAQFTQQRWRERDRLRFPQSALACNVADAKEIVNFKQLNATKSACTTPTQAI